MGASTPFTTIEAESGTLAGGAIVRSLVDTGSPPAISSPELEASGRSFVQLNATGQSVSWTNPVANATAINVRFCIPDGATGGGTTATLNLYVNGVFRQALTFSSAQSWLYETGLTANGMSNTPGTGLYPHLFWDEAHAWISGAAVASGSTIMLKQDAANTSAYYYIDCIDLEAPPAALTQPANSLSVIAYGATANGVTDDTNAIQDCINAAQQSSANKTVWLPPGTYIVTKAISATTVTIAGAGMWYTTIYKKPFGSIRSQISLSGSTIENLYINTNSVVRALGTGSDYGINTGGSNWVVENVWLQHTDAAIWASGTGGLAQNCRIANSFADGINLNNGNDIVGNNLTAKNNFVRGAGDDGVTIYANNVNGTGTIVNTAVLDHNTSIAPWWANCLRVAGGENLTVSNNLLCDGVTNQGMTVSIFGTSGFPLISATINNNTIERCGGTVNFPYGMFIGGSSTQPVTATVTANIIDHSLYTGVGVGTNTTLTFGPSNQVTYPGTTGIDILANSTGTGTFTSNVVSGVNTGQVAFINNSPTTFTATRTGNTGF